MARGGLEAATRVDGGRSDRSADGSRPVVGRAGKPTLFGVWTMRRLDRAAGRRDDAIAAPLIVRDRAGRRTTEYEAVLRDMAMV